MTIATDPDAVTPSGPTAAVATARTHPVPFEFPDGGPRAIVITAGPGWGKTTAVSALAEPTWAWCQLADAHREPSALLRTLHALPTTGRAAPTEPAPSEDVDAPASTPTAEEVTRAWRERQVTTVVLDDAEVLVGSDAVPVLRELLAASDPVRVVILTRRDLGLIDASLRAAGQALELGAAHLALPLDAISTLVEDRLALDRALAARVLDATGGWPALVDLALGAVDHLAAGDRSAAVDEVCSPAGAVGSYLDAVVLAEEDDATLALLARIALLQDAQREALPETEQERLDALLQRGLARQHPDGPDQVTLVTAMRRAVRDRLDRGAGSRVEALVDELAAALLARDEVPRAIDLLAEHDRSAPAAELLLTHGERLLRAGHVQVIETGVRRLRPEDLQVRHRLLRAEALTYLGDWVAANELLRDAGLPEEGPLPPSMARQAGLVHHMRGDLEGALTTYARGLPRVEAVPDAVERDDPHAPPTDAASEADAEVAALAAWHATACWLRGELDAARGSADLAMRHARTTRDDVALALAHTAAALLAASDGDRHANEAHYRQALHAAEQADDQLQASRIRTNWGSHHLEEGEFDAAREQTEAAIDLAERCGFAMIAGIARCNRAEILLRTGELDQAIADADRGREVLASIGARTEAYAHHLLGSARTERGELSLAQQAYERALRLATPAGDRQALVPAYLGLAEVLAVSDPDAASDAADTALELDEGMLRSEAHLARAWVATAREDLPTAREQAQLARQEAAARDNALAVAEATTCLALLEEEPLPMLREARSLWEQLDTPLWVTRLDLAIARRSTEAQERTRIDWLERRLAGWGCPPDRGSVAHRLLVGAGPDRLTALRVLGGFVAEREGRPLTPSEWGSRKAQDLVKILSTRSGRGVTREELAHLLWPDQPYDQVSNRLSVALSLARSALGGEDVTPIVTQGSTVRLATDALDLDVDAFTELADAGLRAARDGDTTSALPLLIRAEEVYGGDLLEDDVDADWATDRRLELRTTYLEVARTVARLVRGEDPDLAIRMLLRVLDRDGYDEPAHLNLCLALLRGGRHGEARRRFRIYADRMEELELPVVPFHQLSREAGVGNEVAVEREAS